MTVENARTWLITASLLITGGCFLFFILAPTFSYPIDSDQSVRILQIIIPVFIGYLGSATYFVFNNQTTSGNLSFQGNSKQVKLLIQGPVYLFCIGLVAILIVFWKGNSASAPPGAGMEIDGLATWVTVLLSILTVTTNVIVAYLFSQASSNNA